MNAPKRRIVFVDDEPRILSGLKRSLRAMGAGWEMEFYSEPSKALEAIQDRPADVVVSDMRMPQFDGASLLAEVKRISPGSIRIILSGQAEPELILRSLAVTHAYLDKPCDPEELQRVIDRSQRCRELITDPALHGAITQIDRIPSLPDSYQKVTDTIREGKASAEEIGRLIAQDVGMSARILQIANSAVFHFRRPVDQVEQAATLLGTERIQQLVLSVGVFSVFDKSANVQALTKIWRHSLDTSVLATQIAEDLNLDSKARNTAATAAMLHECGKLVLLAELPERYEAVRKNVAEKGISVREAELEEFGTDHARVGAYVCSLWGLPDEVVDVIAFHAKPYGLPGSEPSSLTAVHAGCALAHDSKGGEINEKYTQAVGVTDKLPLWREFAAAPLEQATA